MTKIKCCKCNKKDAVWLYMSGHNDGNDFFCDDCVPRGCSCNQYAVEEFGFNNKSNSNYIFWNKELTKSTDTITSDTFYYEPVDERRRRYPCCEYDYEEDGFNEEDFLENKGN